MEETKNDDAIISKEQEEVVLETTNEGKVSNNSDELAEKLAKAEELANNYKIRAEKAEKLAKSAKVEPTKASPKAGELGTKDLYALMEAKVAQDDIDDVVEYANFKKIPVAEALKTSVVKTMLSEKAEQRNIAEATNTGSSKRSSTKISDDVLLSKASKGELPDDYDTMLRLARARKGLK